MKALITIILATSLLVGAASVSPPAEQELPVRNARYTIHMDGMIIHRCTRSAFGTYTAPNGDDLYLKNGALVKEESDAGR